LLKRRNRAFLLFVVVYFAKEKKIHTKFHFFFAQKKKLLEKTKIFFLHKKKLKEKKKFLHFFEKVFHFFI